MPPGDLGATAYTPMGLAPPLPTAESPRLCEVMWPEPLLCLEDIEWVTESV